MLDGDFQGLIVGVLDVVSIPIKLCSYIQRLELANIELSGCGHLATA